MASITIRDTQTGQILDVVSGMTANMGDARRRLLAIRRPAVAAKLAAEGKQINTISVEPAPEGRYSIEVDGQPAERFALRIKSFRPAVRPTYEQFADRDPAHLKQDAFYAIGKGR